MILYRAHAAAIFSPCHPYTWSTVVLPYSMIQSITSWVCSTTHHGGVLRKPDSCPNSCRRVALDNGSQDEINSFPTVHPPDGEIAVVRLAAVRGAEVDGTATLAVQFHLLLLLSLVPRVERARVV